MTEQIQNIQTVSYPINGNDGIEAGAFVSSSNGDIGYVTRFEKGNPSPQYGKPQNYIWVSWLSGFQSEHRVSELNADGVRICYHTNEIG